MNFASSAEAGDDGTDDAHLTTDSEGSPSARTERNFSPMMSSASSQEIGTNPGSSSLPLLGFVRFMGVVMRFGL